MEILTIRFQAVPEIIRTKIFAMNGLDELNALLKKAMTVSKISDI